jgi:hypothetical protein
VPSWARQSVLRVAPSSADWARTSVSSGGADSEQSGREVRVLADDYGPDTCRAEIAYHPCTDAGNTQMLEIVLASPGPVGGERGGTVGNLGPTMVDGVGRADRCGR